MKCIASLGELEQLSGTVRDSPLLVYLDGLTERSLALTMRRSTTSSCWAASRADWIRRYTRCRSCIVFDGKGTASGSLARTRSLGAWTRCVILSTLSPLSLHSLCSFSLFLSLASLGGGGRSYAERRVADTTLLFLGRLRALNLFSQGEREPSASSTRRSITLQSH